MEKHIEIIGQMVAWMHHYVLSKDNLSEVEKESVRITSTIKNSDWVLVIQWVDVWCRPHIVDYVFALNELLPPDKTPANIAYFIVEIIFI